MLSTLGSPEFFYDAVQPVARMRVALASTAACVKKSNLNLITLCAAVASTVAFLIYLASHLLISPCPETTDANRIDARVLRGTPHNRESFMAEVVREQEIADAKQVGYISYLIARTGRQSLNRNMIARAIVAESKAAGYDPIFVAALIRSESSFNSSARSHAGAQGLMQVKPSTAKHISKAIRHAWAGEERLKDPSYNIKLGINYFRYLEARYGGNRERALMAYNWGPARVSQSLKTKNRIPSGPAYYARSILKRHQEWRREFESTAERFRFFAS